MVLGSEVAGDFARELRLIELILAEADREGAHRLARAFLHQRDDQRRVDATGQESAQRHVREHLLLDDAAEQRLEAIDPALGVARIGFARSAATGDRIRERPVGFRRAGLRAAHVEPVPGRQFEDAAEDALRRRDAIEVHEGAEGRRGLCRPAHEG